MKLGSARESPPLNSEGAGRWSLGSSQASACLGAPPRPRLRLATSARAAEAAGSRGPGWGLAVKMAAVVEVEVGGGAVAERELDEVRGVEGQERRDGCKVEGEEVRNRSRRLQEKQERSLGS